MHGPAATAAIVTATAAAEWCVGKELFLGLVTCFGCRLCNKLFCNPQGADFAGDRLGCRDSRETAEGMEVLISLPCIGFGY